MVGVVIRVGSAFFKLLAELMKQNPPYAEDAPILARLARIGLVPGQDFDASKLASVPNIQDVPKLGVARIVAHYPESGADVNGWTFFKPGGVYGTDYIQRALITRYGLGCNSHTKLVLDRSSSAPGGSSPCQPGPTIANSPAPVPVVRVPGSAKTFVQASSMGIR
jgi:hypothetical protein